MWSVTQQVFISREGGGRSRGGDSAGQALQRGISGDWLPSHDEEDEGVGGM